MADTDDNPPTFRAAFLGRGASMLPQRRHYAWPLLLGIAIAIGLRLMPGPPVKELLGVVAIIVGGGMTIERRLPAAWTRTNRIVTAMSITTGVCGYLAVAGWLVWTVWAWLRALM
jgi:hypothetical protein